MKDISGHIDTQIETYRHRYRNLDRHIGTGTQLFSILTNERCSRGGIIIMHEIRCLYESGRDLLEVLNELIAVDREPISRARRRG